MTDPFVDPGNPPVALRRVRSIEDGHSSNLTRLDLGVHSGTHVDAPAHFFEEGAGVERLALEVLIGRAQVIEATGGGHPGGRGNRPERCRTGLLRVRLPAAQLVGADGAPARAVLLS